MDNQTSIAPRDAADRRVPGEDEAISDKPKSKRERDKIKPKEKIRVLRAVNDLARETLKAICRENVMPKRTWTATIRVG